MAETPAANTANEERSNPLPEWAETAFRLWVRGQRNYSALGRQFGVHRETVKRNVEKFARVLAAAEQPDIDAWQEAVIGQEEILSEAWRTHANGDASNQDKLSALKLAQDAIEQIAILKGVTTRRGEMKLIGNGPRGEVLVAVSELTDDELAALAGVPTPGDGGIGEAEPETMDGGGEG